MAFGTSYVELEPQQQSAPKPSAAKPYLLLAFAMTVAVCGTLALNPAVSFAKSPVVQQYDVDAVDWAALRADLVDFVSECGCGPILVRLSWHDSGTYDASDGSGGSHAEMRFPEGESTDPANAGLNIARGLLQPFKERHSAVSLADLWALAATVAIEVLGGPVVPFRAGRTDGSEAESMPHGRLPDGSLYATHLRTIFYRMGFNDEDIVALSGAHTIGHCHADRSGFDGPWTNSPLRFNSEYFGLLLSCNWEPSVVEKTHNQQLACKSAPGLMMLHTDYALVTDDSFNQYVHKFAEDEAAFFDTFAKAFHRLQELGHHNLREVF